MFVVSLVIFVDAEGAICGNKVVEEGEECDCGYVEDKSCEEDVCCMGRNKTDGCTRMPGENCRLVQFHFSFGLSFYGIHCAHLRKHGSQILIAPDFGRVKSNWNLKLIFAW